MKLRKQSGFITPPELAISSALDTLFVDGQSSEKDSLESTDALLHVDILGISANLLSKGHSKRLFSLLSSVHLIKSNSEGMMDSPEITIFGDNPVSIKYGRPYIEYGASYSGVYNGSSLGIEFLGSQLPEIDTFDGAGVKYSIAGAIAYRGINWLAAVPVMTMVGGDVSITTAETFTDEGTTLLSGNDDLTVVVISDVDDNVAGSYTVEYNATSILDVIVQTLTRNVTVT